MSFQQPIIPKGVRDFDHTSIKYRNYVLQKCISIFQQGGFLPLETPALEYLDILQKKYGEEGDQLIFKILDSGNFLSKISSEELQKHHYKMLMSKISAKGLRYDLTLPLARYVAKNHCDITFPFKRYQIQPVWRADRPQKGRYREFYQCDIDIVGSTSLLCEVEILLMIIHIFELLQIKDFKIKINHRKILQNIVQILGHADKEQLFCATIDKLHKVGEKKVYNILQQYNFDEAAIQCLKDIFQFQGCNLAKIDFLTQYFIQKKQSIASIKVIKTIVDYIAAINKNYLSYLDIDYTLARGLTYYTGPIMEVVIDNASGGSLGGGGRYDNLTAHFGLDNVAGIGFSFGIERILNIMAERNLFALQKEYTTKVMIVNDGEEVYNRVLPLLYLLRSYGISTEIYLHVSKLKKQLHYANKKNIPYVLMLDTKVQDNYVLKDMHSGKQHVYTQEELINYLKN